MKLGCLWLLSIVLFSSFAANAQEPDQAADPFQLKPCGFVLATVTGSSAAVDTFGNTHAAAYTAASNPVLAKEPREGRLTFQAQQSRLGLTAGTSRFSGRLEMDFFDASKASPTTTALFRLRRATASYTLANRIDTFTIGQDWDLMTPQIPFTFNLVGHYFGTGDFGFMRHQLTWQRRTEAYELAVAAGMQSPNGGAADGLTETSFTPTLALRMALIRPVHETGIALIGTAIKTAPLPTNTRQFAGGVRAYQTLKLGQVVVVSSVHLGRNLANLGTLSLSQGYGSTHIDEWGAYTSARYNCTEAFGLWSGFGITSIINPKQIKAAYAHGPAGAASSGTGFGMETNLTARIGADVRIMSRLTIFAEAAYLQTKHHLLAADAATWNAWRYAALVQSGAMLSF